MKRGIIWMLVAFCLGLMVNCGGSNSESSQTQQEMVDEAVSQTQQETADVAVSQIQQEAIDVVAINLNDFLQTKEVLAKHKVDKEREQKIESIMEIVGSYLSANVRNVLEENLHRKKTSVEEKAISVVPILDNSDKSILEFEGQFRNGKVSSFSIEALINENIEIYNDEHLYNRLHTVSLNLFPTDRMGMDSLYHRLVSKEWKNEQNSIDLTNQVMSYYGRMLQSEHVLEQMIGIE